MRPTTSLEQDILKATDDLLDHILGSVAFLTAQGETYSGKVSCLREISNECGALIGSRTVQTFQASEDNDDSPAADRVLTRVSRIFAIQGLAEQLADSPPQAEDYLTGLSVMDQVVKKTIIDASALDGSSSSGKITQH